MSTLFYSHSDCRQHDMGPGHPECPQRLDAISDHLLATGLDIALQHMDAPMATIEQLQRAHSAGYVMQLKDLLEQVRDSGQPKALDPDTLACPGTWHAALRAVGAKAPGRPAGFDEDCLPRQRRDTRLESGDARLGRCIAFEKCKIVRIGFDRKNARLRIARCEI